MLKLEYVFLILVATALVPGAVCKYQAIEPLLQRLDSKRAPPSVQEAAALGLLKRLLPNQFSSFLFKIVSKDICGGDSCFLINNHKNSSQNEPEIIIRGTTAVEIASGLHWYLKYWCGAHISWDKTGGIQTASVPDPGSLPRLKDEGLMIKRPVPWNYYQNVVTSSYSYVWWDWERWEKELDWMALQGVNLPLAFTGQEAIWQKVFKEHGPSRLIGEGRESRGLYYFKSNLPVSCFATSSPNLLHDRLGHPSLAKLKMMVPSLKQLQVL